MQIFLAAGCSAQDLCKSRQQSAALPRNCTNLLVSQPISQPEMCISFKQSSSVLHVQLSWPVPSRTDQNRLACKGYFSQGSIQRQPLFHGSMFSIWRLHARRNSKTSHQVSLSLDLWHAHHNLDVIKNHQSDAAELIPHINLAALTAHFTSRSSQHIQLSCFG